VATGLKGWRPPRDSEGDSSVISGHFGAVDWVQIVPGRPPGDPLQSPHCAGEAPTIAEEGKLSRELLLAASSLPSATPRAVIKTPSTSASCATERTAASATAAICAAA